MKPLFQVLFFLLIAVLSQGVYAQKPDRDTVLQNLIQSYGGEENLRKLDSVVQEWDMVALMGNRHGTDVRSMRIPDQLKVELTYPDKTETRILDGETARVIFNGGEEAVVAPRQRDAMRLQLMRLYSPLVLRDKSDSVVLQVEGKFCALSLLENGVRADYLVNQENWRIEKVVGTLTINGSEMQFLTEYSDFRMVDGILMHHRENKFAGPVNTAILQLRQVQLEAELTPSNFLPE